MNNRERYDRNILLFGESGQARIEALRVAIVGLGGLGSHVAQQIAYLGVQKYSFIDHDIVTASSLNRLIGSCEEDALNRTLKVEVARRVAVNVHPDSDIETVAERVGSKTAQAAIGKADIVFGCVDSDLPRLQLTELSAQHRKPYIDLASDVGEDQGRAWYGGRIVFTGSGQLCLSCAGLLDQRELARASMTTEQLEDDDRLYGVPRSALNRVGPSVVSVNGVVASLAVIEFMVWASGIRLPYLHLRYRGDLARVTLVTDPALPNCYYCKPMQGSSN